MARDVRIEGVSDNLPITIGDSPSSGAFGRLRTADPFGIYDYKQIASNYASQFSEVTAGAGTITYQYDRSSTYLTVGTASGDRSLRQTSRYFPYVPGKSQLIILTGIFGQPKDNVDQYIGLGDELNGYFFKLQDTSIGLVIRSAVTGTAIDTFIDRSDWNIDTLEGNGKSGIVLDITKAQIFIIDFQWLGVGRIRFSFDIDGMIVPVHEVNNSNVLDSVYMKTPTLPIRYEVINTGISASSTTLEQICSSVASEGGYNIPGQEFAAGNGTTRRAVTARTPVFAIRLKTAFPVGEPNRMTARFLKMSATSTSNDAFIELAHIHEPSAITATWTSVGNDSAVEYSTNITAVTGNPSHIVDVTTAIAGLGSASGITELTSEFINAHSFISQNFDSTNSEIFVIYATSFAATANVSAAITWIELI